MARLVVSRRPMLPAERSLAVRRSKLEPVGFGFVAFVAAGLTWVLLAPLGGVLASSFDEAARETGRLFGVGLGVLVFVVGSVAMTRLTRRERQRAARDVAEGQVEVLEIETGAALELETDHSSVSPATLVDVGEGRVLLLCGQWLWDAETYGAPAPDAGVEPDPDDGSLNHLPGPHTFPSTRFSVTRLTHTGEVLRIQVEGEPLRVAKRVGVELTSLSPRASELLEGTLDDAVAAIARLGAGRA